MKEYEPPKQEKQNAHNYTGITNLGGEMHIKDSDVKGQPLVGRGIFIDGKEAGPGTPGWRDSTPGERVFGEKMGQLGQQLAKDAKEGRVRVTNLEGGIVNIGGNKTVGQMAVGEGAKIVGEPFSPKERGTNSKEKSVSVDPTFEDFSFKDSTAAPKNP